jgi:hypothetical protein
VSKSLCTPKNASNILPNALDFKQTGIKKEGTSSFGQFTVEVCHFGLKQHLGECFSLQASANEKETLNHHFATQFAQQCAKIYALA